MSGPLRWGVMATGGIAVAFAADLTHTETGRITAIGSRKSETAERFADRFDIPNRHGDYESLAADPEVDAVYVATPAPMHLDCARLALRAGKPVLVEKPFTADAAQARELVALARETGVFAMEAMWTRFLPHVVEIRRLLAEGALGTVVTVIADHGQRIEGADHRLYAAELGGGALLDLGVYPVSFASMVLGTPERIISHITPAPFGGVDGQTSMVFGYDTGAHALLTCTLAAKSPTRASIVGTEARIEIEGDFYKPSSFTLIPRDGEPQGFVGAHRDSGVPGSGLYYQTEEVARCLREGLLESPIMPLDESVTIIRTLDAVRALARSSA